MPISRTYVWFHVEAQNIFMANESESEWIDIAYLLSTPNKTRFNFLIFLYITDGWRWFEADSDGADKFISYLSIKVPGRFASFGRIPRNSSNLFLIEKWTQEMSWDIWQSKEMTRCCHHRSYSHKTFDNESDSIRMLIFSHEKVS